MKKMYNVLYLIIFIIPLSLFFIYPLRGINEVSVMENRKLEKIPNFKLEEFINGKYQNKIESAISDQLILSQTMRKQNKKINNYINTLFIDFFKLFKNDYKNYIEVSNGYFNYDNSDYLIEKPIEKNKYNFSNKANYFNKINIKKYIYFIEKDRNINFDLINEKEYFYNKIRKQFKADDYARFEITSFDEYKEYFYQTDHHWNYKGSYKGYKEIINLLLGSEEKLIEPIDVFQFDFIFYGSADRNIQSKISREKFTVYKFKKLNFKIYINDVEREYSNKEEYFQGIYDSTIYKNHYDKFYGSSTGKIVYDFSNLEKENLLVLSTSYTNAIKELVAAHFNKTHYIDLRYCNNLDIKSYIKENNINKLLLMGDIYSFAEVDKSGIQ